MRAVLIAAALLAGCATPEVEEQRPMSIEFLNPEGMHANPAFSQGAVVSGPHKTVYVGGQNAVDADGGIVGEGDLAAQSAQAARNVLAVLEAAGASREQVVRMTIHIVEGQDPRAGMAGYMQVWGRVEHPAPISVVFVAGLAHPEFLVEVDAIAVVPEGR